jgi:hypothetical protein
MIFQATYFSWSDAFYPEHVEHMFSYLEMERRDTKRLPYSLSGN